MKILFHFLAIAICAFSLNLYSQGQANNWYFGANAGLTFNTNPPSALTNGALNTSEGCATLSDANGNLLFYTDGIRVYNRNHVQMPNGNGLLGDPSSAQSGIIIPKPGSNTNYYIITVPTTGANGMRYSEVDMTLNGGLGDVLTTNKNTLMFQPSSEKVTAVKHANNLYYWVIGRTNGAGRSYYAFLIDCNGVNLTPIISNNVATTNGENWGYLVASPNGSKLASASSGTGVEIADFNTSTGVVSNNLFLSNLNYSGTAGGNYGVAFSPNGNLLYATSITNWALVQWDLTAANIPASEILIGYTGGNGAARPSYRGGAIQLAPDGKIYITETGLSSLGVINNPNVIGAGCNYVVNQVGLGGRTARLGLPPFIQSFFDVTSFGINHTNHCITDSISFSVNGSPNLDSLRWYFGEPSSPQNSSNLQNPKHKYSAPGSYTVTLIRYLDCIRDTVSKQITIYDYGRSSQTVSLCPGGNYQLPGGTTVSASGTYIDTLTGVSFRGCDSIVTTQIIINNPQINAGADQLICYGNSAQLNATGINVLDYSWDPHPSLSATNIPNPIASPTTTTSYIVTSKIRMGTNLVTNGDFNQGNTGFSSGYTPITAALSQGQYVVTTDPYVHNNGFTSCGDHTTGNSNMLLLDGACGTNGVPPNTVFWCQTIPVTPNTDYAFSAWLTNVLNSGVSSTLQFTINGVVIGTPPSTTTTACQWSEFYVIWNSGSATSANICIAEGTGVCSGNDFAVDDISFYQICEAKDTVTVRVDRVLASFTDSTQVSCFGLNDGEATFTPSSGIAPFSYTWSNGQNSTTAANLTAGTYTVTVTDSAGCTANGSITITEPAALSLAFNPATTNLTCFGDLTQITTTVTGGTTPYTYSWNTGASTPDLNNIPIGFYRLEVRDSNNCFIADSTTITQPNLITSSFNTIQCNAPSYTLPSGRIITVSGVYIDTIPNFNGCDSIITLDVKLSNIQATVTPISVTCFGLSDGSASVNATGGIAPYAYQWSDNQTTPTAYNLIAGNYAVIIRDSVDCRDTLTVQITEPSELIVSTTPPVAFCNGLTTTIEAFANGGIAPYAISWDNGHNNWSQHVQPTSTTTYTATVTDNNGCVKNNSVTITVHPNPVADFSIEPSENIILGTPITITDNSTLADDRDWSMDDGNNYQNDVKFTHLYENEGEYCIELVVTTVNNCTDNHRACITIVPDFSVYIPNTFTPNDDKLNQRFRVVARSFSTMSMSIFNRWGQELIRLEGDQPVMFGWDGTYNGSPAPEGTYAYKLEVFDLKNKKHVYFGQINLIR